MLIAVSALKGYAILATDGRIGSVSDVLFDDESWRLRWLVVDTGTWLSERKVLVHPSAIGQVDHRAQELPVRMSKAQIERSPDLARDRPVSLQMQSQLYDYYGWDPVWGGSGYFGGGLGMVGSLGYSDMGAPRMPNRHASDEGDPHLRSITTVTGSHLQATDGEIGHVENMLIDDASWDIRYLIVDTKNWWFGKHVLISPYAVKGIAWSEHTIRLDVTRDRVKTSPAWDPIAMIDQVYEKSLHNHYGWRGYGF
ncbi:PRC-barrel domain-containing protein [Lichenifustis flavocetrariae]|uniref:PRC-barrel domain-containing protein n=1 Tax=Lichenifustis flavocetrariae TaxID=2949735 RepID=A0AA41Z2T7_9HYPH|nr:PRC-barrel domain-containing protein [Lichenifustis flavocetrariae]MCW6511775.1 PRC-barrel domain-containing protein [Lichenifustis flavocetrariae]